MDTAQRARQGGSSGHIAKTIMHEITADPTGLGSGLVASIQGRSTHQASSSKPTEYLFVGLAGDFHYTCGCGSKRPSAWFPFKLKVRRRSMPNQLVPSTSLHGLVGNANEDGCHLTIHAADRMGGLCLQEVQISTLSAIIRRWLPMSRTIMIPTC